MPPSTPQILLAVVAVAAGFAVGSKLTNPKLRKARPNKLGKLISEMPKTCGCGRVYTEAEWQKLPLLGYQEYDWGEAAEYRDCPCKSTLTRLWECTVKD